jgi:TolB protein
MIRPALAALLACAVGSCRSGAADPGEFQDEPPVTQLTLGRSGQDRDPELSPDGRTLVYASSAYGPNYDLYARPVAGGAPVRLTGAEGHERFPKINPVMPRVLAFSADQGGEWQICLMEDWIGAPGKFVTISDPGRHHLHPSWSPDGKMLAWASTHDVASGEWVLQVRDLAAGRTHLLEDVDGFLPEWSPKSDRIVFQRMSRRGGWFGGLWTIDFRDGAARNLRALFVQDDWAAINPCWSPDGRRIVFATVGKTAGAGPVLDRTDDLWVIDAEGSAPARLTSHPASDAMPAWGSDGRVYFVSDRGGAQRIWSLLPRPALP